MRKYNKISFEQYEKNINSISLYSVYNLSTKIDQLNHPPKAFLGTET